MSNTSRENSFQKDPTNKEEDAEKQTNTTKPISLSKFQKRFLDTAPNADASGYARPGSGLRTLNEPSGSAASAVSLSPRSDADIREAKHSGEVFCDLGKSLSDGRYYVF